MTRWFWVTTGWIGDGSPLNPRRPNLDGLAHVLGSGAAVEGRDETLVLVAVAGDLPDPGDGRRVHGELGSVEIRTESIRLGDRETVRRPEDRVRLPR